MSEIIELQDYKPHETNHVICSECGHKAISIHPFPVKYPLECSKCGAMAMYDEERFLAENKRLKIMLQKALGIIREGKALYAPNTTNAFIDDWIKDCERITK